MATTGPNLPSTVSNSGTATPDAGSTAWVNISNILLEDGSFATSTGSTTTQYALCSDFGLSVPSGSTINGIVVSVKKKGTNSIPTSDFVKDNVVKLIKAGTIVGSDKADTSTNWSSTLTSVDYGSSSDLWGTTWTSGEINSSAFGVAFSANPEPGDTVAVASIDSIKITVHYTAGSVNQGIMF